jgi:hypothetical protein
LRHLPLAERVVERVVDKLRIDAETRCLVPINRQRQCRTLALLIGCDVL